MGSLPFTIHNISHHNKKRSPRSFEKRSEGKYLCTPSYRGLLVTAVLLFGRSTAVSQSIWLKKKKGLSSRKLIHTKYVEYTHIKEVVVHVMAKCNVQVLRHRDCYRWFIKKRTWVPLSRAGVQRCSSSRVWLRIACPKILFGCCSCENTSWPNMTHPLLRRGAEKQSLRERYLNLNAIPCQRKSKKRWSLWSGSKGLLEF